jgi:hypothetical protein
MLSVVSLTLTLIVLIFALTIKSLVGLAIQLAAMIERRDRHE